jgi:hypothetical protein
VGGTGVLRPAVAGLCARNIDVTAVSRSDDRLSALAEEAASRGHSAYVHGVRADYTVPDQFKAALEQAAGDDGLFKAAMVYAPDAPEASLEAVAAVVCGRLLLILTSRYAAPDRRGRVKYPLRRHGPIPTVRYLLLGWHVGEVGPRWHTPEEISEAALDALCGSRDAQLGVVRPWGHRPD